jgi:hypothetical protein
MVASPVVHGAVEFAAHGQVGALVRPFCGERLIDVDAKSGRLAGMHQTIFKTVGVREGLGPSPAYGAYTPECQNYERSGRNGSAAAMQTGLKSVAPCEPVRT